MLQKTVMILLFSLSLQAKMIHTYEKECRNGDGLACMIIADSYQHGSFYDMPIKKEINKAVRYFKKGCSLGLEKSCNQYKSTFAKSLKTNAGILQACQEGHIQQCYYMGMIYKEIQKDPLQAIAYLDTACKGGAASACLQLGSIYLEDNSVKTDFNKAIKYYTIACDNNISNACMGLGMIYDSKLDTQIDYKKAMYYYQKACDMKNYNGCNAIGVFYIDNRFGIRRDYKKALEYYAKACSRKPGGKGFGVCLSASVRMIKLMMKQKK